MSLQGVPINQSGFHGMSFTGVVQIVAQMSLFFFALVWTFVFKDVMLGTVICAHACFLSQVKDSLMAHLSVVSYSNNADMYKSPKT